MNPKPLTTVGPEVPRAAWLALLAVLALAAGCQGVKPTEQRLVSRPAMLFTDQPAYAGGFSLLSQIEPGAEVSGGGGNSGCTSCR